MKKLKLEVDEIHVEGFELESAAAETRGTVHGLESYDCWASYAAATWPCEFCLPMPITYSCEAHQCA
jgi:hypothetical protein